MMSSARSCSHWRRRPQTLQQTAHIGPSEDGVDDGIPLIRLIHVWRSWPFGRLVSPSAGRLQLELVPERVTRWHNTCAILVDQSATDPRSPLLGLSVSTPHGIIGVENLHLASGKRIAPARFKFILGKAGLQSPKCTPECKHHTDCRPIEFKDRLAVQVPATIGPDHEVHTTATVMWCQRHLDFGWLQEEHDPSRRPVSYQNIAQSFTKLRQRWEHVRERLAKRALTRVDF